MSKKIIVTGTSRGIGLELVKQLVEQGHQVLALSRNEKPCTELGLEQVTAFSFDIASETDLKKVQDWVKTEWKTVDVLIHNAGALVNKPFNELTATDFQKVYEVNVFGVAHLTQAVLPYMHAGSHVLTISSMGGVQGSAKFPGLAAYSSSKGAVITLSELLAEEYKEQGIAFNVLALGAVQTEMLEEAFPGYQAPLQPDEMAAYIANFALTAHKFYNGKVLQVSASTP
ncbi:MAG: short-chain dehydrogenase [Leeuwenhoekiella sp.]|uniref:SDR family NAD(P)-dependent oxidoreductase n=1 Tax=unclassified Leeuwenhoekiella TaxID=2615029 RepID=UPI000C5E84A8|nr:MULTISPECIES: SDR family oxidoreductase [unclassified Leeuwenhoekiella]MAS21257.1 short-chain dehydrogenase [Leeuwenhoekiella sp.]MAW93897.1 short-chain dehydrogenase [Leeuwenhoekiella sp.]MBA81689.1 short-chain dehydrogenase [Leeuwenhoekiella sp.]|tara:strand:+ start:29551 stop:30234 length:684 start_codon:yes stop_codon:yes gene_type:complete